MRKKTILLSLCIIGGALCSMAQEPSGNSLADKLLRQADSLRTAYSFEEASQAYQEAMRAQQDSVARIAIEDRRLMADNGLSLIDFVCDPKVVARHTFSLEDFFLFYPMADRSWMPSPNPLDTLRNSPFVKATYFPKDATRLYYSAIDDSGSRNIYHTEFRDTVWSSPSLLNESLTSSSDEIYPMLSPDGKSLYFASSGLYGVGGYDLFVSTWDEDSGDWNVPVNMGFPFSSPADDFLYVNSDDGKYTIFASNRDCSKDSVTVYVLEFDNIPIRRRVEDPVELRELSHLAPQDSKNRIDNSSSFGNDIPDNIDTRNYVAKIKEVRSLQNLIKEKEKALDEMRSKFAMSEDVAEKSRLSDSILEGEMAVPQLQDSLGRATRTLQKIEMDFLFKGVVLDPEQLLSQADRDVVGASTAYAFTRQNMRKVPQMKVEDPVRKMDYSFKILPEGRFAPDNTLPSGLVYQIQIFSKSSPATVADIKGLSPVFESRNGSRYVYRAGVFRHYADALDNINKVKKAGFRDAVICAFNSGRSMSISQARRLEATILTNWKVVINAGSDELPAAATRVIRESCEKDVIKTRVSGMTVFVVAAFSDRDEAERLASSIKESGVRNVTVEEIVED